MSSNITINTLPTASTIDGSLDILPIYTASSTATQGINRNTLLNIASNPVGISDSQTLTNKVLTSPTINGATLSGTLSGTYTIGGSPTFPASVVSLTGSQTLTNKVLTNPTINSPTITNATLSADTITGYTVAGSGTVYGLSIASGAFTTSNIIPTASLQNSSVTGAKIASYFTNRRNATTNITETAANFQTGWIYGTPGAANFISIAVTFPVAYTNVPIVIATFGGDTAGATSTLGSGGANINNSVAEAYSLTTTGFTLRVASIGAANWSAGNTVYAQWIAIGT